MGMRRKQEGAEQIGDCTQSARSAGDEHQLAVQAVTPPQEGKTVAHKVQRNEDEHCEDYQEQDSRSSGQRRKHCESSELEQTVRITHAVVCGHPHFLASVFALGCSRLGAEGRVVLSQSGCVYACTGACTCACVYSCIRSCACSCF
eukprot:1690868-Pleurochrysis_carterae.AAC.7